jgi:hypothetical protein
MSTVTNQPSAWSPFRRSVFLGLWIASLASSVFLTADAAKESLIPAAMPDNGEKTRSALLTVMDARDLGSHGVWARV